MPLAFPPFGAAIVATPAGAAITIAASTWRWDGTSGGVRVSSGVVMQPGSVTAANLTQYRVFVGGVEQAVAVRAADGTFPDGSYRSILTQYLYTLTNNLPVAAEIRINQGVRGTTDIAWVEPRWDTVVSKKAVIAPTDPAYLCGTFATLAPLTPATNDSGADATWAASITSGWAVPGIADGSNIRDAIYEHVAGCWTAYCRTGLRSWYQWAYDWAAEPYGSTVIHAASHPAHLLLPYTLPATPGDTPCTNNSYYNPEPLTGSNDCGGFYQENYSLRADSLAVAYWWTGWRQFKRSLAKQVNYALAWTNGGYAAARDHWIDDNWGHRFNLGGNGLVAILTGYLTGCTTPFGQFGIGAPTTIDYEMYLPWVLQALEDHVWNVPGDYRNGLVGQRHGTIAFPGQVKSGDPYGITNFQLSIVTGFLIRYYDLVKPDSRIPPWIKTICDYMIGQSRAQNAFDQTYPNAPYITAYLNMPPAGVAASSFTATLNGTSTIVWTAGGVLPDYLSRGMVLKGSGIPANAVVGTHTIGSNNIPLISNASPDETDIPINATESGSRTISLSFTPWYLHMFPLTFAWYYAYSGDATYNTWATRALDTGAQAMTTAKNWGEYFGDIQQSVLYYRHGGTIRGIPGAHPTSIVNPPPQPVLG